MVNEMLTVKEAVDLLNETMYLGGATHWFRDGGKRYTVGNGNKGITFVLSEKSVEPAYIAHVADTFENIHYGQGIGFWLDKGTLYVDPVWNYDDLDTALTVARQYNELAIYDNDEGEVIKVCYDL
jgi:hypothetical protein